MTDETGISNHHKTAHLLKKKNVVLETVNSTFLGVGACFVAAALADSVYSSTVTKKFQPPNFGVVCELFKGKLTVGLVALGAAFGCINAINHNRDVEFAKTLERHAEKIKTNRQENGRGFSP